MLFFNQHLGKSVSSGFRALVYGWMSDALDRILCWIHWDCCSELAKCMLFNSLLWFTTCAVDNYVHFWYMSEKMYFYFSIFNLLILKLLEEELGSQMSKEVGSWRFVDRLWSWILNGELFSWWVYDRSPVHQGVCSERRILCCWV